VYLLTALASLGQVTPVSRSPPHLADERPQSVEVVFNKRRRPGPAVGSRAPSSPAKSYACTASAKPKQQWERVEGEKRRRGAAATGEGGGRSCRFVGSPPRPELQSRPEGDVGGEVGPQIRLQQKSHARPVPVGGEAEWEGPWPGERGLRQSRCWRRKRSWRRGRRRRTAARMLSLSLPTSFTL
jgi:hypothetical protein